MIDVVIPTMMAISTEALEYSIAQAYLSGVVNQIIIIDNSGSRKFKKEFGENIVNTRVLSMSENIFVNASWNLGVSKCTQDSILIMNDDIFANQIVYREVDKTMKDEDVGICSVDTINCNKEETYTELLADFSEETEYNNTFGLKANNKTGWFFCVKKNLWKNIPEEMKCWYGDDLTFMRVRKKGYKVKNITSCKIGHMNSATTNRFRNFHIITDADTEFYKKLKKKEFFN